MKVMTPILSPSSPTQHPSLTGQSSFRFWLAKRGFLSLYALRNKACKPPLVKPLKQQGFTLLELIIVMAIIAISAGLILPRLQINPLTELKVDLRNITAVLKHARRMSMITGQVAEVSLYAKKNNEATQTDLSENTKSRRPHQWISKGSELRRVDKGKTEQQASYKVTFYPGGGSSGGEFSLYRDPHQALVKVDPITGKVKIEFDDE